MENSSLFLWIAIAWACLHFLVVARRRSGIHNKLPPGPTPLPIIGNLHNLGNRPHESLANLSHIYGPIITLHLGCVLTVVASSADMAREVLQNNDQAFSGRTVVEAVRALHYAESAMAWQPTNPHWRKLRLIYKSQMFTTQRLDANQSLRHRKVHELIEYMKRRQAMDIGRAAFVTTLNLLSNAIFSVDLVDPNNAESAQEFKEAVHGIMEESGKPNLPDYFPWLRPLDPLGVRKRISVHFRKLYEIFDKMIEERLLARASSESAAPTNDFLDILLDQSQDNELKLSRRDVNAFLTEIFSAGSDTSSSTVEWAMAELLRNPNVMAKARLELTQTIGSGHHVQESDIARLPYLQAVIKETLRLHPPVPLLIPHRAETTVEICGYIVPKNTQVFVNVWAIGRDPALWVDPNSFRPERFIGSDIDLKGRDFGLMPFGAGRRICPGLPLGLRMVHLMLASLLHSFAWKLPDGMGPQDMDMSEKFGITLQMAVPLRAIPVQEN